MTLFHTIRSWHSSTTEPQDNGNHSVSADTTATVTGNSQPPPTLQSTNNIALPMETWTPNDEPKRKRIFSHYRSQSGQQQRTSTKSHNVCVRGLRLTWSFSVIFLLLILTSLVIVSIALWLFNHFKMRSGVNDLAKQDRELLLLSVYDSVKTYTERATELVRSLVEEIQWADRVGLNASNPLIPKSRFTVLSLMLCQLEFSLLSAFWFGTEENFFTGLSKAIPFNTTQTSIVTTFKQFSFQRAEGNGALIHFRMNDAVDIAPKAFTTMQNYYPAVRPWYVPVKESKDTRWSPLLLTKTIPQILAVAVASPFFHFDTGEFLGVLGGSLNVISISNYLKTLPSFDTSRVFIVDEQLNLIASDTGTLAGEDPTDPTIPAILNAKNSSDYVIRETAVLVEREFGVPLILRNDTFFEIQFTDSHGTVRIATMLALRDSFGLNWNFINVFSEETILSSVFTATRTSILVTCCLVAAAIVVAFIVSVLITVPLYHLSREVSSIKQMNFQANDRKIRSLGFFEISTMSNSLNQLKNGLRCFDVFVPSEVVKVLVRNSSRVHLGVVKRRMSIGFADMTFNFNSTVNPSVTVEVLQTMFTELSQIVSDQGGVVDKYISECVMFLFNAPLAVDDHELRAVRTAQKIVEKIDEMNIHKLRDLSDHYPAVSIRIGINSDECLVGNVGSKTRFNYTALGDAVNVASRLISLNSRYGTQVILGPKTRNAVFHCYVCRWLSCLCVKGKTEPLNIYELKMEREKASEPILQKENELLRDHPNDKALLELRNRLNDLPHFRTNLELGEK